MDPDLPPEPIKMPQTLEEAIAAKEEWRRRMRALPFPEKIRRLVELQKRRAPIVARWGKVQKIWQLPPHDPALTGYAAEHKTQIPNENAKVAGEIEPANISDKSD